MTSKGFLAKMVVVIVVAIIVIGLMSTLSPEIGSIIDAFKSLPATGF